MEAETCPSCCGLPLEWDKTERCCNRVYWPLRKEEWGGQSRERVQATMFQVAPTVEKALGAAGTDMGERKWSWDNTECQ